MSRDYWFALGAMILAVTIAVGLLVLARSEEHHPALTKTEYDERLAQLDREAIEAAYVQHVMRLFSVWTTDYSLHPPKAVRGAANGRSAYIRAMNEVARREKELSKGAKP